MPLLVLTWHINANCEEGDLQLDFQGPCDVVGTVLGAPLFGFWDEPAQKLTFMRLIDPGDPQSFQVFTGYLMTTSPDQPCGLAGSFEAFRHGKPTAGACDRSVFGWFALPR